ncbi:hypothetical protein M9978_19285 [Sphingomonas sp. MG17]|uniref:SIR2-like domain-containing protein n=2 Tax=Sphingomonas tagetis TaxID=2949092 RepID=A0A9X2HJV7_9SPHN|nr:hypothetical protein [Sphingomonas tagetis]
MAAALDLDTLLATHAGHVALVIGNGINRHGGAASNSWEALLMKIAARCGIPLPKVPQGTQYTEFYDVLGLRSAGATSDLAAEFCELMAGWQVLDHHRTVVGWASRHAVPVLTTNFEEVLSEAAGARFLGTGLSGFTDYYPWQCRFAHDLHLDPCAGFGIWHINGMARYKRSVRLGLSDYVGSAHRAREMFHRGGSQLFRAKDPARWAGARTWLHLFFNKPLLFLGLALEENEVFLRWLLIERARYFRKFPRRRQPAWYVYKPEAGNLNEAGKLFFLQGVDVTCLAIRDHDAIWASAGWTS